MSRFDRSPLGVSQLKPHRWIDSRPAAITFLTITVAATLIAGWAAGWALTWWIRVQVSR